MEIYQQPGNRVFDLKNNYDSKNYGLEVEVRKSLSFIDLPVIRNITVYGNFTYMDARVRQMLESVTLNAAADSIQIKREILQEEKRPLSGQSNYMYNAGLFYDSKYLDLSVTYNYVTNRVFRPSLRYLESLFERPVKAMDLQLTGHFYKRKIEARFTISNLLNSYSVIYQKQLTAEEVRLGLENKLPASAYFYKDGNDLINYIAKPGRTYGLTINYNF